MASTSPVPSPVEQQSRLLHERSVTDLGTSDMTMSDDMPPIPAFNFDNVVDGPWSDSDDDNDDFDQTGEYTGKFKVLSVPTKADPPSSCTRDRQEAWGRPISPFPRFMQHSTTSPVDDMLEEATADPGADQSIVNDVFGGTFAGLTISSSPHEVPDIMHDESPTFREDPSVVVETSPEQSDAGHVDSSPFPIPPAYLVDSEDVPMSEEDFSNDTDTGSECGDENTSEHVPLDVDLSHEDRDATPEDALPHSQTPQLAPPEHPGFSEEARQDEDSESEEEFVDRELSREPEPDPEELDNRIPDATVQEEHQDIVVASEHYDSVESSDDESDDIDEDVIQITSGDPVAAARAAAILKMHDYDCIPRIMAKRRRLSHRNVDTLIRTARRRSAADSGVGKHPSSTHRRHTFGGIVGEEVVIPGSPALKLPQLLKNVDLTEEANRHLNSTPQQSRHRRDPFRTPLNSNSLDFADRPVEASQGSHSASQGWTKTDWKLLDSCFTDERLEVGSQQGSKAGGLAGADDIDLEHVVERFVQCMGGPHSLVQRPEISREDILRRAQALQKKQRSGKVAPPTPGSQRSSLATNLSPTSTLQEWSTPPLEARKLPFDADTVLPSLTAPRYSHLWEEAMAVSAAPTTPALPVSDALEDPSVIKSARGAPSTAPRPDSSLTTRLKGFLFSYLPTTPKPPPARKTVPQYPSLPPPPPEIFEKPRPPIETPAPKPLPKVVHPKELIHLHPVPPVKPSMIPRISKQRPQRMVELHPAPQPNRLASLKTSSNRRSSGGSVKDLIQTFEELKDADTSSGASLRRVRSVGDGMRRPKPIWRP